MAETSDIAYYQAISGEIEGPNSLAIFGEQEDIPCLFDLPYLSELAPYEDCRFIYTARRYSLFQSHAYILIVQYDEAEYSRRIEELDSGYIWRSKLISGQDEGLPPEFELDGFSFRTVEGTGYPKWMLFIGVSDERHEIAYIYVYDQDLDYISPSVGGFLAEETGWKKVVD